jgi:glycosyltransferase domain-containing protein
MSLEILKQLTLVIPSYNRPGYLIRNLKYWEGRGPTVYALDGSIKPLPDNIVESFSENIHYFHLPVSLVERLKIAKGLKFNNYTALLADDDLYIPSGLISAIKCLESDPLLKACIGRPLGIDFANADASVIGILGVYQDMNNNYEINGNNPAKRMYDHMSRYMPSTIYSVLRSEDWKKAIEAYTRYEFASGGIGELQVELSISYLGNSKVIPVLSWLKSIELEQVAGPDISLLPGVNALHDCWHLPEFKYNFHDKFLKIMSEVFSEFDGRDKLVISNEIETAMDAYVVWCQKYFAKMVSFYKLREFLKITIPKFLVIKITEKLRKIRSKRELARQKPTLIQAAKMMEKTGTLFNFIELSEISEMVKEFHLSTISQNLENN